MIDTKKEKREKSKLTPFEVYQEKNKLKKREKKLAGKEKRELIKK